MNRIKILLSILSLPSLPWGYWILHACNDLSSSGSREIPGGTSGPSICTPPTILSYQKKGILSCDLYGVELESSSEENSSSSPSASPDYVSLIHEAFAQQTTELGGIICIMDAFQNFGVRPFTRSRWHGSDGLINGNRQQTWWSPYCNIVFCYGNFALSFSIDVPYLKRHLSSLQEQVLQA